MQAFIVEPALQAPAGSASASDVTIDVRCTVSMPCRAWRPLQGASSSCRAVLAALGTPGCYMQASWTTAKLRWIIGQTVGPPGAV